MQLNNIKGALLQGLYAINCKKDAGFYARQVCTKNRKVKKTKIQCTEIQGWLMAEDKFANKIELRLRFSQVT